jgi:hypothetical protein
MLEVVSRRLQMLFELFEAQEQCVKIQPSPSSSMLGHWPIYVILSKYGGFKFCFLHSVVIVNHFFQIKTFTIVARAFLLLLGWEISPQNNHCLWFWLYRWVAYGSLCHLCYIILGCHLCYVILVCHSSSPPKFCAISQLLTLLCILLISQWRVDGFFLEACVMLYMCRLPNPISLLDVKISTFELVPSMR